MSQDNTHLSDEHEQWLAIYDRLQGVLSARGESSPFGEGEYWLLDDDWGNREHLLHVFREEFLTSEMVYKLKNILQDFDGWKLVVAMDVVGWDKNVVPPMGLNFRTRYSRRSQKRISGRQFEERRFSEILVRALFVKADLGFGTSRAKHQPRDP